MQHKLIFLDIDGVVNTLMIDTQPFDTRRGHISRDGFYYDLCNSSDKRVSNRQAIMWLNKLCVTTGAQIVISSTWRYGNTLEEMTEYLQNSGLLPEINVIGFTPDLRGNINFCRGDEINLYLRENFSQNDKVAFVILDDDSDMADLMGYLVHCDVYHGFGYPEYLEAIQVFEKFDFFKKL